ncbi:FRG domain-containing protein [Pseudoalteromonas sp. SG43-6]|uniref:FRG domain-containing protein n=1 Tax=Pseudoalteromonas sp. SG43-6 TaxID=2760967 RepID=UPI001603528F|nr:FRG domain-containing protein [Pseudoalteromonas sp. SG43-6]MBB1434301.1 FRG domain-containing protein [Pseudoalteromonas sp. SG43-6]
MSEIRCISELLQVLEPTPYSFFRGQANFEWSLEPSLARIKHPESCYSMSLGNWLELESYLIREFQKFSYPYLKDEPQNKFDWLVHAQHHGLPTRLLDWSENPLKALFFAIENREYDEFNGALHLCAPKGIAPSTRDIHQGKGTQFFFSSYINDRVSAQEGAFSIPYLNIKEVGFSHNLDIDTSKLLAYKKVLIPKEAKPQLRHELNKLGINHRTIYPGLDGISKMLNEGFG